MAKKPSKSRRPLAEYDAKRNFAKTPEPKPVVPKKAGKKGALSFCVQKHLASHLHYDFRLEHEGVLLSWAVPKGPSLNPADKRMAMRTEDHPLDYGSFEGVIPEGYGAGIVVLWDTGTWEPEEHSADIDAALKKGELKFRLDGVKLKGSWVLVRTRGFSSRESWLLIKHRDKWAGEIDVTTELPESVKGFGDFADVLAAHGEVPAWKTAPPARGGDAGSLYKQIIPQADKIRAGGGKPARAAKAKSGRARSTKKTPASSTKTKPTRASQSSKSSPAGASKPPSPKKLPAAALRLGDKRPKLSNQDKVLFPKSGFTKGDLVDYYTRIAPLMLPHLVGRAVSLKRYPDGVDGKFFFEKRCNAHRPPWVKTVRVEGKTAQDKTLDYCEIADLSTLVWVANLAAIEIHVPLALAAAPDRPTAMVFDLDPGLPATQADCVPVALRLKGLLDGLGLQSVVKTSGGKGLHVLVPLNTPNVTFDDTKHFARAVATTLEQDDPKRVIASMSRAARAGKVFIDWSQNDRSKTTVCVFSVRAREEPTVSWPLAWPALQRKKLPPPHLASDKALDAAHVDRILQTMSLRQRLPAGGVPAAPRTARLAGG